MNLKKNQVHIQIEHSFDVRNKHSNRGETTFFYYWWNENYHLGAQISGQIFTCNLEEFKKRIIEEGKELV